MNTHLLKIWPEHYNNVLNGTKTFEIRVNDRAFQKGDKVILREVTREGIVVITSKDLKFDIGDVYPIDSEKVVFSLLNKEVVND
jgi:ASC-1-like (ASCH) protein